MTRANWKTIGVCENCACCVCMLDSSLSGDFEDVCYCTLLKSLGDATPRSSQHKNVIGLFIHFFIS